jgi:hypothetical protein
VFFLERHQQRWQEFNSKKACPCRFWDPLLRMATCCMKLFSECGMRLQTCAEDDAICDFVQLLHPPVRPSVISSDQRVGAASAGVRGHVCQGPGPAGARGPFPEQQVSVRRRRLAAAGLPPA